MKCGGCVDLTALPPSMSRLSGQCGILNISQPYRPPRSVTGIALLFFFFTFFKHFGFRWLKEWKGLQEKCDCTNGLLNVICFVMMNVNSFAETAF
jgi:hypothetical protein